MRTRMTAVLTAGVLAMGLAACDSSDSAEEPADAGLEAPAGEGTTATDPALAPTE